VRKVSEYTEAAILVTVLIPLGLIAALVTAGAALIVVAIDRGRSRYCANKAAII
jgi:hypothetical protein